MVLKFELILFKNVHLETMRAWQIIKHMRQSNHYLSIRQCSSTKKQSANINPKDIINIYTQKWEPRILELKNAMNTDINIKNVHHFDKCHDQINELNIGLKKFCKSIASAKNTNIETLNQNINNLHQQLQDKTKSNQKLKEEMVYLQQELQSNDESMEELKTNTNKLNSTLTEITNDRDGLNVKLNENEIIIKDLKKTNNSIQQQLEEMQNELKMMERQLIEAKESEKGDINQDENESQSENKNEDVISDTNPEDKYEVNKTKQNMANLLRDLVDLENQYSQLKMVCIGLGSVLLIGLIDVYRTRQKLKQTRLAIEQIQEKFHGLFFHER